MNSTIRVLLADDHEIVRTGIKFALRAHDDLVVVGEARDGIEAVREAKRLRPELVVLDVRMPNLNGIEACREICSEVSGANVLMLTSFADEKAVMAAVGAGAAGPAGAAAPCGALGVHATAASRVAAVPNEICIKSRREICFLALGLSMSYLLHRC